MGVNERIPFSRIMLEQYLLNELPQKEADQIADNCRENRELCEYLEKIRQSNNEILSEYTVNRITNSIKVKLNCHDKSSVAVNWFKPLAFGTGSIAIVVLLLVFVMPDIRKSYLQSYSEYDRVKGTVEAKISLYRKVDQGYERLFDSEKVSKGDLIQIGYQSMGMKYGVILSIDGRGGVTLHYPYKQDEIPLLKGQAEHYLRSSYELDDAPDFERFIFIYSEKNIAVSLVLKAAEDISKTNRAKNGDLDLPKNMKQISLILKKKVTSEK